MGKKKPWLGYDAWLSEPYDDFRECPECLSPIEEDATECPECGYSFPEPDFESMTSKDDDD